MLKEIACIMCPAGCDVEVEVSGGKIISVRGNTCPKGKEYVKREITDPQRNIATSVLIYGGEQPLVSVRLNKPVAKDKIFSVMDEVKAAACTAPIEIGQVLLSDVASTGSDIIATKHIKRRGRENDED